MAATYSLKLNAGKVELHALSATLPAPSAAGDGGDVSDINQRTVAISLFADGAVTITDAWLCGYDAVDAKWYKLSVLNSGVAFTMTATLGWEDTFTDVAVNDQLAVLATITGGNNVGATAKPIEVTS